MNIGIFDIHGKNKNPLTNEPYTKEYLSLAKKWSILPAYQEGARIVDMIKKNQVVLLTSGTGSGKTVLVPKFALHALDYNKKIAITIPKKIVTKSSAEYAAKTLDVELGKEVGYQYRGSNKNTHSDETKLLYCTDGTLVSRLVHDPLLTDFSMVIIDEAHERKIQIDLLLLLLKKVLKKRKEFRLVVMSATMDTKIYANYFKSFNNDTIELSGKPNYPVKSHFLTSPIPYDKVIAKGNDIIHRILKTTKQGDILFFLTSSNECIEACEALTKTAKSKILCIPVYSGMDNDKLEMAKDPKRYREEGYERKVVISTNVAESSITIDGIVYVVDSGHSIQKTFQPSKMLDKYQKKMITQDSVKQRKGRTGRIGPGECYHLYTEKQYDAMKAYSEPDILKSDIRSNILSLFRNLNTNHMDNVIHTLLTMLQPPLHSDIKHYLDFFEKNKVLISSSLKRKLLKPELEKEYKNHNLELTVKGVFACMMTDVSFESSMMIYHSIEQQCLKEMCFLVAILETTSYRPINVFNDKKERQKVVPFLSKYGDHVTMLRIFDTYLKQDDRKKWCEDMNFDYSILNNSKKKAKQLFSRVLKIIQDKNEELAKPRATQRSVKRSIKTVDSESEDLSMKEYNYEEDIDAIDNIPDEDIEKVKHLIMLPHFKTKTIYDLMHENPKVTQLGGKMLKKKKKILNCLNSAFLTNRATRTSDKSYESKTSKGTISKNSFYHMYLEEHKKAYPDTILYNLTEAFCTGNQCKIEFCVVSGI